MEGLLQFVCIYNESYTKEAAKSSLWEGHDWESKWFESRFQETFKQVKGLIAVESMLRMQTWKTGLDIF